MHRKHPDYKHRDKPNPKVKLYAKLEGNNPSGSIKDRIALYMIEAAEKREAYQRQDNTSRPHRETQDRDSPWSLQPRGTG
jgi:hypothetical protein